MNTHSRPPFFQRNIRLHSFKNLNVTKCCVDSSHWREIYCKSPYVILPYTWINIKLYFHVTIHLKQNQPIYFVFFIYFQNFQIIHAFYTWQKKTLCPWRTMPFFLTIIPLVWQLHIHTLHLHILICFPFPADTRRTGGTFLWMVSART